MRLWTRAMIRAEKKRLSLGYFWGASITDDESLCFSHSYGSNNIYIFVKNGEAVVSASRRPGAPEIFYYPKGGR